MDLRALKYFVASVEAGSISGAAHACHVAQPSITLAISKLESQFSCQLLNRHRKGVNTTAKGFELYTMAVDLLQHADGIESRLAEKQDKLKLSIALERSVQIGYVEQLIQTFKDLELTVEFQISANEDLADIRLCSQNTATKGGAFFPIETESYALLIPLNNELAFKKNLSFDDLNGQTIIERQYCENSAMFDQVMRHFGLHLPVAATVDNEEWALSLVAAGLGISISPLKEGFQDPRFKIRRLEELSDMETPERQIGICFKPNTSAAIQKVLDKLSHYLTKTDIQTPVKQTTPLNKNKHRKSGGLQV